MQGCSALFAVAWLLGWFCSAVCAEAASPSAAQPYSLLLPDGRRIEIDLPTVSDRNLFPDPVGDSLCEDVAAILREDRESLAKLADGRDPPDGGGSSAALHQAS